MCTCKYHVITTGGKKKIKRGSSLSLGRNRLAVYKQDIIDIFVTSKWQSFLSFFFFFSNVLLKFVICTRIVDTWCVIVLFLLSHADGRQCTQSSICLSKFVFAIFLQIFIIS